MKKYNLFKVLGITIIVAWLLTLFIPGSYVDYSGEVVSNSVSGVGIWTLFSNLSVSVSYFNSIAIFLIALAIFYAVLNKVTVYNSFVDKVSSLFKGKERLLVIITMVVFGILAMLTNDYLILLLFVPFIYKVMKNLEVDNKVILSSTLVSSLIGAMCGIYNGNLFNTFNLEINTLLLVKVLMFVVSMVILVVLVAPKKVKKEKEVKKVTKKVAKKENTKNEIKKVDTKKVSKNEKKVNKVLYAILTLLLGTFGINKFYAGNIKAGILRLLFCWTLVPTILSVAEFITVLTEKADKNGKVAVTSTRRTNVLFGCSLVIFVLFVIMTIIPWESLISGCTVFSDFNTWLGNLKIGEYAVFSNIIGAPIIMDAITGSTTGVINAIGSWTLSDVSILLVILSIVIAIVNSLKFDEFVSTSTEGIKKVLPVAITAMLISLVIIMMVNTGVSTTISNWIISWFKGFNIATTTLATIIGSVLTADFYYFMSTVGTIFAATITNTDVYGVIAFILQSVFNFMMIIAPTSVGLIIGLYYLNIPYNKWFKFIWKVLLAILIVIILTSIIIYSFV